MLLLSITLKPRDQCVSLPFVVQRCQDASQVHLAPYRKLPPSRELGELSATANCGITVRICTLSSSSILRGVAHCIFHDFSPAVIRSTTVHTSEHFISCRSMHHAQISSVRVAPAPPKYQDASSTSIGLYLYLPPVVSLILYNFGRKSGNAPP